MLRIDPDSRKSSEHAASAAADRRRQNTFEPKFKSFHKLDHGNERLFVKGRHGVIEQIIGPRFIGAFFAAFAVAELTLRCRARKFSRPLDGARDVFSGGWR